MLDRKRLTGRLAAACLSAALFLPFPALSFPAYAQSPEFAYSAEKWAALRDNKLEYDEIADLVHEYNNTVVQNNLEYQDYKSKTRDDIAQDYYDRAEEIYSNIEYPDTDDSNYGSQMSAALNSKIQADNLMEQGDESVEDSETLKLGYDQTEAGLVQQAQGLMISYRSQYDSLESLRERKTLAEASYQSELTRMSAGMSTQASVLSAKEAVTSAEASILSAESNLEKTKQSLCLMLGWDYGIQVEIGELPELDLDEIAAIDVNADVAKAQEQSYSIRLTTKRLENARTTKVRETLAQTLASQQRTVANSVKSAYESLILARSSYEQVLQAYGLEQVSMEAAERKLQAGTMTKNAYQTQKSSYLTAEVSVQTQKLSLLQAKLEYDWAVAGLAAAS